MKKPLLILSCSLICLTFSSGANEEIQKKKGPPKPISTGDNIYTWIDEKGNKIYSDQPREGAELMEIQKGTDYKEQTIKPDWNSMQPKVIADAPVYTNFAIVSPSNKSTVRNNAGTFQVALDIRPKLIKGHRIKLEVDGVEQAGGSQIIALNNVDRGSHTLVAYILDANGDVITTTPSIVVHMHRAIQRKTN